MYTAHCIAQLPVNIWHLARTTYAVMLSVLLAHIGQIALHINSTVNSSIQVVTRKIKHWLFDWQPSVPLHRHGFSQYEHHDRTPAKAVQGSCQSNTLCQDKNICKNVSQMFCILFDNNGVRNILQKGFILNTLTKGDKMQHTEKCNVLASVNSQWLMQLVQQ